MSSASHLCLVMPLYGGDLKAFTHRSSGGALPFPLVRQILFDVLRGLRHAHSRGWIHTDLKRDNIFVENHMSTTEIRRWLEDNPPRRHPLEQSLDCVVQAAVSQPLPVISLEMAMRSTFVLGDFSCGTLSQYTTWAQNTHKIGLSSAQPVGTEDDVDVTILPLRPPEVILGYPWSGASSDIWSFGCLVRKVFSSVYRHTYQTSRFQAFQIVTGQRLFSCGEDPDANSAADALNMLYDMMCITNEAFKRKLLEKAANLLDFFTVRLNMKTRSKTFALKKHAPQITPRPLESCIAATGAALTPADMEAVAALVRRCLRLDPEERPTADVLLSDPIFHGLQ